MAKRTVGLAATIGALAAMLGFWAPPLAAEVVFQTRYADTETFSFDDCGFTISVASEFSGHVRIRADRGGQAFYLKDTFSFRAILTNVETGEWFVVRGHGVFNEVKATHVGGNVYDFTSVEAGQPFVIEDAAGNVVVRDRGVIRRTVRFDTLGDGVPGAVFLEVIDVSVHGPHPGFADDFPFCELAAELTGA